MKILTGKVVQGEGWGSLIGFPTANLRAKNHGLSHGVYAVWVKIFHPKLPRQKIVVLHRGLAVIGVGGWFKKRRPKVEVHLLDFKKNIVGHQVVAEIVKKIRPVKKFPHTQKLIAEIKRDIAKAKAILGRKK